MRDSEDSDVVPASLIDQRVGKPPQHQPSYAVAQLRSSTRVRANVREPVIDLVKEHGPKAWTLAVVVVGRVVHLKVGVFVETQ